jgi:hypothetical protein
VIEFDSLEAAVAAYHSAGYQEALRVLGDAAERDLRILPAPLRASTATVGGRSARPSVQRGRDRSRT